MATIAKSSVRTGKAPLAMFCNDISPGRSESLLRFRLIHFWEAKNISKGGGGGLLCKDLYPLLVLKPTEQAQHAAEFFCTKSKEIYRVAEQGLTISFSKDSVLSPLDGDDDSDTGSFPVDRGDLYDVVGHLKLVNGQALMNRPILDEVDMISMGHILVHMQNKDEPIMKLYMWDAAAREFYMKFTSSKDTPTVLMVTTLSARCHPHVILGQPKIEYFNWLSANPEIAERVNTDEVTKVETMTIGQIFAYIKREDAKKASFYCVATIGDVVRDLAWYYIACSGCQTKATKGPSSLMCVKCGKNNVSGVAKYLAKISVYDNKDQSLFVLLANQELGVGHQMPAPQVLIDTIGQTYKVKIKVSNLNLTCKIQAITVTKIVLAEVLPPLPNTFEFPVIVEDEAPLPLAVVSDASGYNAGDGTEGTNNKDEAQMSKRPKHD
ncbi:hypothetical protein N665_0077s0006 [Sinapis alba]|nr:hypothetical protein N665_0077s0006 [Sinapis alba]